MCACACVCVRVHEVCAVTSDREGFDSGIGCVKQYRALYVTFHSNRARNITTSFSPTGQHWSGSDS